MIFSQPYGTLRVFGTCPTEYSQLASQVQSILMKENKTGFILCICFLFIGEFYLFGPGLKSRIRFNTYLADHSPT